LISSKHDIKVVYNRDCYRHGWTDIKVRQPIWFPE
jgi:hypothetical protein